MAYQNMLVVHLSHEKKLGPIIESMPIEEHCASLIIATMLTVSMDDFKFNQTLKYI